MESLHSLRLCTPCLLALVILENEKNGKKASQYLQRIQRRVMALLAFAEGCMYTSSDVRYRLKVHSVT